MLSDPLIAHIYEAISRITGMFACLNFGGIWMVWKNAGGFVREKHCFG